MALDSAQARQVTPTEMTRLRRWASRKPCVALMGEFSAGKSTLLNFLIGENILPTKAIATELPPIWFSHGKEGSFWVDQEWNQYSIEPESVDQVPVTARFARLYIESDILEACDVIDTPGISDPNLAAESWRTAAGFANMVLWCTSATQAWRETERSTWNALPARLRKHSLMVITRADKLLTEIDREKVARRMTREAGNMFAKILFIATPDAVAAKEQVQAEGDSPLWTASGAAGLIDEMATQFDAILDHRSELLGRYRIGGAGLPGSTPRPLAKAQVAPRQVAVERPESDDSNMMQVRPARIRPDTQRRSERPAPGEVSETPSWFPASATGEAAVKPVAREVLVLEDAVKTGVATFRSRANPAVETLEQTEEVAPLETKPEGNSLEAFVNELEADLEANEAFAETESESPESEADARSERPEDEADVAKTNSAHAPVAANEEEFIAADIAEAPREVMIWRDIVEQSDDFPGKEHVVGMIDQLLLRLYGESPDTGSERRAPDLGRKTSRAERLKAAEASKKAASASDTAGWRRLA